MSTKKTSTARTRAYRRRLAEQGFESIYVAVDRSTVRRLRAIAKEHQRPMAEVIAMGALLSQRALSDTAATPAE